MGNSGLVVISNARNWASFSYIQGPEFHLLHNLHGKKIMKAYAVKSPTSDGKVFLLCLCHASQVWVTDLDCLGRC